MFKGLLLAAAVAAVPAGVAASSMAADYPGAWLQAPAPELLRTLAKNSVKGCGDMAYRRHASQSGEYLVYCTRDGRTWTAWLAWTSAERVMGPYRPDPGLPLPR